MIPSFEHSILKTTWEVSSSNRASDCNILIVTKEIMVFLCSVIFLSCCVPQMAHHTCCDRHILTRQGLNQSPKKGDYVPEITGKLLGVV
jgi:hypothetical protein